jgi:hypothetical protein
MNLFILIFNWIICLDFIDIFRTVALYNGLLHCVFGYGNSYFGKKSLLGDLKGFMMYLQLQNYKIKFLFLLCQIMMAQTYLTILYRS